MAESAGHPKGSPLTAMEYLEKAIAWSERVRRETRCLPGILSARRYELCDGEGALKYLAIYELENEEVLQGEAYLKNAAESTPMDFTRPKVQRLVYRQVFPESGAFENKTGAPASRSTG